MEVGNVPQNSQVTNRGFLACLLVFAFSSCANQPEPSAYSEAPGFFYGWLHGFLIIFQFIGSLFMDHRIYAFPNSGRWYDFGFVLERACSLEGWRHHERVPTPDIAWKV